MTDYKELYKKLDGDMDIDRIVFNSNTIGRINEIVYDMMKELPDPELWEMLEDEYPNCDPDIIFLEDTEWVDLVSRENGDKIFSAMREYKDRVNFNDRYLIYWNGEVETVNRISDISYVFDWDYIFEDLLYYRIWDYIEVEDNPELKALFMGLEKSGSDDFEDFNCAELDNLMFECWKRRNDGPEWVKLSKVLENAFNRIAERGDE